MWVVACGAAGCLLIARQVCDSVFISDVHGLTWKDTVESRKDPASGKGVYVHGSKFSTRLYNVHMSLSSQRNCPKFLIQVMDYMIRQPDSLLLSLISRPYIWKDSHRHGWDDTHVPNATATKQGIRWRSKFKEARKGRKYCLETVPNQLQPRATERQDTQWDGQ